MFKSLYSLFCIYIPLTTECICWKEEAREEELNKSFKETIGQSN